MDVSIIGKIESGNVRVGNVYLIMPNIYDEDREISFGIHEKNVELKLKNVEAVSFVL
jgi:hypothetical protein